MKNILLYLIILSGIVSGCKKDTIKLNKEDDISQSTLEELTQQSRQLTAAKFGWKAFLYTAAGAGYSYYLKFDTSHQVNMYADAAPDPSALNLESSYAIDLEGKPLLSFNGPSYMHILSIKNPPTFSGTATWGTYSDFSFHFDQQAGDTLLLSGKSVQSKLVLVKATAAEQLSYQSKGLFNSIQSSTSYIRENPYLYVELAAGKKIKTSFNYLNKVFGLSWEEEGIIYNQSSAFAFTLTGIVLQNPLSYKGHTLKEFYWDKSKRLLYTVSAGKRIDLNLSAVPTLPLHTLLGIDYNNISIPYQTSYPGWSADFIRRRAAVSSALAAGSYRLRLERFLIRFDTFKHTLVFTADIYQGATRFTANLPYSYTKTTAGIFKFSPGMAVGNGALIGETLAPITAERLDKDTFRLEYIVHPQNKLVLGQFRSIEHPDFTFAGTISP